jgi:hypothetical protein
MRPISQSGCHELAAAVQGQDSSGLLWRTTVWDHMSARSRLVCLESRDRGGSPQGKLQPTRDCAADSGPHSSGVTEGGDCEDSIRPGPDRLVAGLRRRATATRLLLGPLAPSAIRRVVGPDCTGEGPASAPLRSLGRNNEVAVRPSRSSERLAGVATAGTPGWGPVVRADRASELVRPFARSIGARCSSSPRHRADVRVTPEGAASDLAGLAGFSDSTIMTSPGRPGVCVLFHSRRTIFIGMSDRSIRQALPSHHQGGQGR